MTIAVRRHPTSIRRNASIASSPPARRVYPARVKIMSLLFSASAGEQNSGELAATLGLSESTVSHHLGLLRMNNLIGNRRDGKQVYYGINGRFQTPSENSLSFAVENYTIQVATRGGETEA